MKKQQTENKSRDSYQTGSTNPPKSHQGIITVLLIFVIFLGGIVSGLSMMNIRLFQMLEAQNQDTQKSLLQFSRQTEALGKTTDGVLVPGLGFIGHEVTELCRSYYGWPEGLYIASVTAGSAAEKAGLRQGDILTLVDGAVVDSENTLFGILSGKHAEDALLLTIFRGGDTVQLALVME